MGLFRTEERAFQPISFNQLAAQVEESYRGVPPLTEERALRFAAAWSCIDVLCTTVTSLPVDVIRVSGDQRIPVTAPQVIRRPSPLVSTRVWRYQLMHSLTTDGNAFGWVGNNIDSNGNPTRIDLLHPSGVTRRKVGDDGVPTVDIEGRGTQKLWPYGPVWHVPGKMVPAGSPFALSPLAYAGTAVSAGLEAEEYGARFFTEGGHPSAILNSDQELDQAMAAKIKQAFVRAVRPGSREPAVMGSGITYTKIQSDPSQTAYIDLIRFAVEQACRFWRVPPSMVYAAVSGQNVTYANVSQADLHYLKHSVDGYLTSIEEAFSEIIVAPRQVKIKRDALLRADPKTRHEIHTMGLANQTRTVNEVRELEDEAPFDDPIYDQPGLPDREAPPVSEEDTT